MRILATVVGRPLNLRGPRYAVGERLFLDTDNPRHREVLANGWVRPVVHDALPASTPARASAVTTPPEHRMVTEGLQKAPLPKKASRSVISTTSKQEDESLG